MVEASNYDIYPLAIKVWGTSLVIVESNTRLVVALGSVHGDYNEPVAPFALQRRQPDPDGMRLK
jgi:hypothetical protein